MIFLRDNTLMQRNLAFDDIKPRLLGSSRAFPRFMCVIGLIAFRPLGYMPRTDAGVLPSQPPDQEAQS